MTCARLIAIVLAGLALACLSVVSPAYGQDTTAEASASAPEDLDRTRQARDHFLEGMEHFRAHRYREAIRAFSLAGELVPSADLWFNIARAHEELSEHELAIEHYQRYLRDRVDPPDRRDIEAHIESLRERAEAARAARRTVPTTGTLRLSANRDGAEVLLNGRPAGTTPWPEPLELEPGRHRLTLLRDGYIPFEAEVSVQAGTLTAAYADLTPETRYRAIRADPIFAWLIWGVGAAAVGTSIGLGVHAASLTGEDLGQARTWAAWSDAALGAAVGLAVLGLIVYFVENRTVGTERITIEEEDAREIRGL